MIDNFSYSDFKRTQNILNICSEESKKVPSHTPTTEYNNGCGNVKRLVKIFNPSTCDLRNKNVM